MPPTCEHIRSEQDAGLFGCRVKGVCTPTDCETCDSHTARESNGVACMMQKPQTIGEGYHRSGWPFAVDAMRSIHSGRASLLLDDFVEQTWVYSQRTKPIRQPWAGIVHHPPNPPQWTRRQDRLDQLHTLPGFAESMPQLRLAICLSKYVADWIEANWQVPTAVVKHPTEIPETKWQPNEWLRHRRLLQGGWYLRNVRLIHQVATDQHRTRLMPRRPAMIEHEANCHREFSGRREHNPGDVLELDYIDNDGFDYLLGRAVVCMEVLDASANNVTIECLARNTPLIVNRHPAVVEYLGPDYPLYFDHVRDIAKMISNEGLILSAHEYLRKRDKSFLSASEFASGIRTALESVQ